MKRSTQTSVIGGGVIGVTFGLWGEKLVFLLP